MKTLLIRSSGLRQRGYVSVIAVLMLALAVLVILTQSIKMYGSKALESQEYYDSVAALAAAESGTELAKAQLVANYAGNGNLGTSCSLTTPASNTVGRGQFTYVSAALSSTGTYCKFRVMGTVNKANRTIETWMGFTDTIGTAGYGTAPTMTLNNNYPVQALAVFDLAWRVAGSDGQSPSSGNVHCTDCATNQLWFDELTGIGNGLGGVGNYTTAGIGGSAPYSHTLGTSASDSRNYTMVGMLMGGSAAAPPSAVGWLKFSNTSNQPSLTAQSATGSAGTGCSNDNANAVVLGISGRGAGIDPITGIANTSAGFDTANLNGIITAGMWTKYVHYPNIDGSSPNAVGDIFSEIFYYYKGPPVTVTGASGNKNSTTITLTNPTSSLSVGDTIKSGVDIPDNTTITAIDASKTVLTISNKLDNKITNGTLCSGICSMVPKNSGSATLTLSRNTATLAKGWVAGIACIMGVNNNYVSVVKTSTPRVIQWHEVISGE